MSLTLLELWRNKRNIIVYKGENNMVPIEDKKWSELKVSLFIYTSDNLILILKIEILLPQRDLNLNVDNFCTYFLKFHINRNIFFVEIDDKLLIILKNELLEL